MAAAYFQEIEKVEENLKFISERYIPENNNQHEQAIVVEHLNKQLQAIIEEYKLLFSNPNFTDLAYQIIQGLDVGDVKGSALEELSSLMSQIHKSGEGVYVQASSLGWLTTLVEFLKSPEMELPVGGICIGPVHAEHVRVASEKKIQFAIVLAFDVQVTQEAWELADRLGIIRDCIFKEKDPIILLVDVIEGTLKVETPICAPKRGYIDVGWITSILRDRKPVDHARKGQRVVVKISSNSVFGVDFGPKDSLVSRITRDSIYFLVAIHRDNLSMGEWDLLLELKHNLKIQL